MPHPGERGAGLVSAWIAFTVFVVVLLFGLQVMFNLYATSVVTAATQDAATMAARGGGGPVAMASAEVQIRTLLGSYAREASFDWSGSDSDSVVLRVTVAVPRIVPGALGDGLAFSEIDRTARVRVERFR